jgi:hypothetical protein
LAWLTPAAEQSGSRHFSLISVSFCRLPLLLVKVPRINYCLQEDEKRDWEATPLPLSLKKYLQTNSAQAGKAATAAMHSTVVQRKYLQGRRIELMFEMGVYAEPLCFWLYKVGDMLLCVQYHIPEDYILLRSLTPHHGSCLQVAPRDMSSGTGHTVQECPLRSEKYRQPNKVSVCHDVRSFGAFMEYGRG